MPPRQTQVAFIVLAAGLGSRLSRVHSGLPKWMVPVDDQYTVAHHQLSSLEAAVTSDSPHVVISGSHAHEVDALCHQWEAQGKTPLKVIYNEHFAEWNNWYSVLLGLEYLEQISWKGSTLIVNGDLFCPTDWFSEFAHSVNEWVDISLAVDTSQVLTEEAMKVELQEGSVSAIGKVGLQQPYGEYIGLGGLSPSGRRRLADALRSLQASGATHDWYEGGIRIAIGEGATVTAWQTPAEPWVEIDDEIDLQKGRNIALANRLQAQ